MNSCPMDSRFWAIQYTHRAAGMAKPIHRDIRGEIISMVRLVELLAWVLLLMALVFMEIREKIKPLTAEITGSRNRPKPPATVQN